VTSPAAVAQSRLLAYSPLGFLRGHDDVLMEHLREQILESSDATLLRFGSRAHCWLRRLDWDSRFFGYPVFRLEFAQTGAGWDGIRELADTLRAMQHEVAREHGPAYVFGEIPAEDIDVLQALGVAGFRLVETRVTYFLDDVAHFDWTPRYGVRTATTEDIPDLRRIGREARNVYDRYHADPFFGDAIADEYLATYAEESAKGFADLVLVPEEGDGHPPGAFFTAQITRPPTCPLGMDHSCPLGLTIGRIPLVAVGAERHGWHLRLMAEMTHLFRERSVDVAYMGTQLTNRAVIHNSEKLGYRFGRATHVFAMTPAEVELPVRTP